MRLNVLGCGVMGRQIASLCALMGYDVAVAVRQDPDRHVHALEQQIRQDRKVLGSRVTRAGTMTVHVAMEALEPCTTIEALPEDLDVKCQALARLPFDVRHVQLFTNTSSYLPTEVQERAIGLHFFNPVCALRCVELCAGTSQLTDDGAALLQALRQVGFEIVRTASHRGYIGNALLFQEIAHALQLIEQPHYSTQAIDMVQRHTGRTTSLFDIIDLVGVDVTRRILINLHEHNPAVPVSPLLDVALAEGVYGRKNRTSIRTVLDRLATVRTAEALA